MRTFRAIIIASFACLIPFAHAEQSNDLGKGAGGTDPKLTMFTSRLTTDLHAPLETVLKISNPAKDRVTLNGGVQVHYHYSPPPGTKMAIEERTGISSPPDDETYYIAIEVTLPGVKSPKHGAWQQPLWLKSRNQNLALEPDQSFLAEMDFPADTLVAGECAIKLTLSHKGTVIYSTEGVVVSVK